MILNVAIYHITNVDSNILIGSLLLRPQGRVLLTEKGIPLEVKDIVASNGIIHIIDGLLVPPSIVPIMPHRCDVNETTIIMVCS